MESRLAVADLVCNSFALKGLAALYRNEKGNIGGRRRAILDRPLNEIEDCLHNSRSNLDCVLYESKLIGGQ